MQLSDFTMDMRVQVSPATDAWMSGDRYGMVVNVGRKYVWVKMDYSGKVRKMLPDLLVVVVESAALETVQVIPVKLRSTTIHAHHVPAPRADNARARRAYRRSGGAPLESMFGRLR